MSGGGLAGREEDTVIKLHVVRVARTQLCRSHEPPATDGTRFTTMDSRMNTKYPATKKELEDISKLK